MDFRFNIISLCLSADGGEEIDRFLGVDGGAGGLCP